VSMMSMVNDVLNFIFFFASDQIRWRACKVGSMDDCFSVGQKEGCMEHIMNAPRQGKRELIGYRRYHFSDVEWSLSSRGEFRGVIG